MLNRKTRMPPSGLATADESMAPGYLERKFKAVQRELQKQAEAKAAVVAPAAPAARRLRKVA